MPTIFANLFVVSVGKETVQIAFLNQLHTAAPKLAAGGVAMSRADAEELRDSLIKLLGN